MLSRGKHRRGHGATYDGLNQGRIDTGRLRSLPAGLPLPRFPDGRPVCGSNKIGTAAPVLFLGLRVRRGIVSLILSAASATVVK